MKLANILLLYRQETEHPLKIIECFVPDDTNWNDEVLTEYGPGVVIPSSANVSVPGTTTPCRGK